jgi:hypothetical protein
VSSYKSHRWEAKVVLWHHLENVEAVVDLKFFSSFQAIYPPLPLNTGFTENIYKRFLNFSALGNSNNPPFILRAIVWLQTSLNSCSPADSAMGI